MCRLVAIRYFALLQADLWAASSVRSNVVHTANIGDPLPPNSLNASS